MLTSPAHAVLSHSVACSLFGLCLGQVLTCTPVHMMKQQLYHLPRHTGIVYFVAVA